MPGTMTDAERKRRMAEFEWANKNPIAAVVKERERQANAKEMTAGRNPKDEEQAPSTKRHKGDYK